MSVTEIQLFQILKAKLGEKEAEELVSFVKDEVKSEFENKWEVLATKEDIANTKEYILQVKSELSKSIYLVGLIQFLAIVGAVIGIINFMLK
jgi:ABC-type antimicrobial peptide transport system permease subunit